MNVKFILHKTSFAFRNCTFYLCSRLRAVSLFSWSVPALNLKNKRDYSQSRCADNDQDIFESVIHLESDCFVHYIYDMYSLWSPLRNWVPVRLRGRNVTFCLPYALWLVSNWNSQLLTVIKQNIKLVLIKGLIKLDKIATNRNSIQFNSLLTLYKIFT